MNRQLLYKSYLHHIDGTNFTLREIDIIACIIHNRGHKKIASLLSVSPRTVSAHIYNIMNKVGYSSRDQLIDLADKSNNMHYFKRYYLYIINENAFKDQLKKIGNTLSNECKRGTIDYHSKDGSENQNEILIQLSSYLKIVNINIINNNESGKDFSLQITEEQDKNVYLELILFQSSKTQDLCQETLYSSEKIILSYNHKELYIGIINLLNKIINNPKHEQFFSQIIIDYQKFIDSDHFKTDRNEKSISTSNYIAKRYYIVFSVVMICIISFLLIEKPWIYSKQKLKVKSDLVLPNKNLILERPVIIKEINNKLKTKDYIPMIALIGIGGVGKSTLARIYANAQSYNVVWEINAQTLESFDNSINELAYILLTSDEEKNLLKELSEIKVLNERRKKLYSLIKNKLLAQSSWLIIYDNVENIKIIENFFPLDVKSWGYGKVIITTRDSNIASNNHIHEVIEVNELTNDEKYILFSKVIKSSKKQDSEVQRFIENIPSFPLDVWTAANYIKATNISYNEYIEDLTKINKSFINTQQEILSDTGNYTVARYNIISMSLDKLIKADKNFADLLLLVGLLDSQNIPLNLLYTCKDKITVDKFIYYLKKYSFISKVSEENTISLHRIVHSTISLYIDQQLTKNNSKYKKILPVTNNVKDYISEIIESENHKAMNNILIHTQAVLRNKHINNSIFKANVEAELGQIYHYLGHYAECQNLLKRSFTILNRRKDKDYAVIAKIYFYLGSIYKSLSDHNKGIEYITKSLNIYQKYFPDNYKEIAKILSELGNVHRMIGNYHQSNILLRKALNIYQNYLPNDYLNISWIYLFLGYIEEELGHYTLAKEWFEQSLNISKNHLPQTHLNIAWSLVHIGHVLRELGFYKEAKPYMDEGLNIAKDQVSKDHKGYANAKIYLAKLENELGNYDKASTLFNEALATYRKVLPEESIAITNAKLHLTKLLRSKGKFREAITLSNEVLAIYNKNYLDLPRQAQILKEIGHIQLLQNESAEAENNLQKSAKIFKDNDHSSYYFTLEILSDLYLKKYEKAKEDNLSQKLINQYKDQAQNYLQESYDGVKRHFPPNSAHIERLYNKIDSINSL